MPKIRFMGKWSSSMQKAFNVPRGYVVFKYDPIYREKLGAVLMKLDHYQTKQLEKLKEKGEEITDEAIYRDLEIDIEYHYRKRTLDQNALMWSLYTIEANEQNGGQSGHKDQMVTPDELYEADLDEWGERELITTKRGNLGYWLDHYRIVEAVILDDGREVTLQELQKSVANFDDVVSLRVIRGSSLLNTKEMANWINRIFNRLAYNGVQVTSPGEIKNYWHKWQQFKNDNKIVLHDTIMTQEEYKALNPICEACGKALVDGTGHLSHIKAIGMGGDRSKEPKRNYTSNWLHLCGATCHLDIWHGKGVKEFLKRFRHLAYKVNTALNREYKAIQDIDNLPEESLPEEINGVPIF